MDPFRALYPTCVLKVNIGCCKACVANLKKLLFKVDGVQGVEIDIEKGQVTVTGKADPAILLDKIQKKKKKAEILSYEDPSMNARNHDSKNKQNNNQKDKGKGKGKCKDCSCFGDSQHHQVADYEPPKGFGADECRDPYCRIHNKKFIIQGHNYVPMVKFQPPPNHWRFPPPPFPYNPHPRRYQEENFPVVYDHRWFLPPLLPRYPPVSHNPLHYQEDLPEFNDYCSHRPSQLLPPNYGYYGASHGYGGC